VRGREGKGERRGGVKSRLIDESDATRAHNSSRCVVLADLVLCTARCVAGVGGLIHVENDETVSGAGCEEKGKFFSLRKEEGSIHFSNNSNQHGTMLYR